VVERRQLGRSQSIVEGLAFVIALVLSAPAAAQPAEPRVTGTISNVFRVESWSFFEPRTDALAPAAAPVGEPDYTYIGDRAELGVRVDGERFDLSGAFNYVRLENLPTEAIGPGGFGSGAFYFAATGVRYSYQLYLGEFTIRMKSQDSNRSITIGRMPFAEVRLRSAPVSIAPSFGGSRLARERIDGRLIGNFEWSLYQRRFDGAQAAVYHGRWQFSAGAFMPTQGGFEESTNLTMTKIQLGTATATHTSAASESRLFAHVYRDRRRGQKAVVDNRLVADAPVDVTVTALGGSHVRLFRLGSGHADVVTWGAAQLGDWYGLPHRAGSAVAEAGYRWTDTAGRPYARAGYAWASGDGAFDDGRHTTFFQMLPSSRRYALSSAYTHMNLRDAYVQLLIEPRGSLARIEVHRVALASGEDLWYQGSGATSSGDRFFGFAGRFANGETSLGTVLEGTFNMPVRRYWSVNAYAGVIWGGRVVKQLFTDKPLRLWSIENVIRF
jgi:hypothetical protein